MKTRQASSVLLATILAGRGLLAIEPLPKELDYQASLARTLPAPYSALMLLRIATDDKLTRPQKTMLAQEGYDIAVDANLKPLPAYASLSEGTAAQWLDRWDFKDLDAKSVAVAAYIVYRDNYNAKQDPSIAFPIRKRTEAVGCDSVFVDDPYDYFSRAFRAGRNEFTQALGTARSSVDVGRAFGALFENGVRERGFGLEEVLRLMPLTSLSDREFGYAVRRTRMHPVILKMAEEGSPMTRLVLLTGYRNFLMRNFAQTRCSDNYGDYKGIITEFNDLLKKLRMNGAKEAVPFIPEEAGRSTQVDTTSRFEPNLSSPPAAALRSKINNLIYDETNITSVLREVEEFQPVSDKSTTAVIVAKSYFYYRLFDKLQDSPYADRALRSWAKYIAYGPTKTEAPMVWYACARTLMRWAKDNPARLAELESSGDPGLAAMARLAPPEAEEETAPPKERSVAAKVP